MPKDPAIRVQNKLKLAIEGHPLPSKVGQVNLYALCVVVQKLGEHPAQQTKG